MKINLRSVDLNLLTIFDAIMRERKMTLAAKRLHMTQPATSHALARLRETFDDQLFIRTRAGMKPTARAEALAGPIRDALLVIQEAMEPELTFEPEASDREFAIGFGRYGELSLLPKLLRTLDSYKTAISIQSYDGSMSGIELVKDAHLDFCIDFQPAEDNQLETYLCGYEDMVVIAREGHPRITTSVSRRDYFSEKHIVASLPDDRREQFQHYMAEQGGKRTVVAGVHQVSAIPMLIAKTDNLATVPRSMAEMFLQTYKLNIFALPLEEPKLPIYLVWNKAQNRDKGHQWLKDLLVSCIQ